MPSAYRRASSVISVGFFGSGVPGKAICPAAWKHGRATRQIAWRSDEKGELVVRARSLIRSLQVLRRFFLRILRVVFRPNRLSVLVHRPIALAGDIEDLPK